METVEGQAGTGLLTIRNLRRTSSIFWTVQGHALAFLCFASFLPSWSHVWEILFVGFLASAGVLTWIQGESLWVRTPIDVPLLLFVAWVLITVPFATDIAYSFSEWRKLVAKVLAFYWALLVLRQNPASTTRGIIFAVAAGTCLVSMYALWGFIDGGGSWRDRLVRGAAPSSDFNWLTTYLVIAIPILTAAAIGTREGRFRCLCGIALAMALLGQVISYSRAGWLGLIVEGLAFAWLTGRRTIAVGVLAVSLLVGGGLLAVSKAGYQRTTVSPETWEYRLALWQKGAREIVAHPLVGVGYGNKTFARRYGGHPILGGPAALHSLFLMVALGSGVPALVFLVWMFGKAAASMIAQARNQVDHSRAILMLGVGVMIMGFAVRNVFDYMFGGSLAYLFWIVIATGLAQGAGFTQSGRRQAVS